MGEVGIMPAPDSSRPALAISSGFDRVFDREHRLVVPLQPRDPLARPGYILGVVAHVGAMAAIEQILLAEPVDQVAIVAIDQQILGILRTTRNPGFSCAPSPPVRPRTPSCPPPRRRPLGFQLLVDVDPVEVDAIEPGIDDALQNELRPR